MKKIRNLNKTQTIVMANLYDSTHYKVEFSHSKFINASLQIAELFPESFKIIESSMVHVVIAVTDLKHCFDLYKHNESKVITRVS